MNRFIKRILLFLVIPFLIGVPLFYLFTVYVGSLSESYIFKKDISTLYCGDSHIEESIDARKIPGRQNIAVRSESFYFSYFKLRMLLKNNPSVEHIFLGLGCHSLSSRYDSFISGFYSLAIAPKYFFLMPVKEQLRVMYWNKTRGVSFLKSVIKQGIMIILEQDNPPFLGGFVNGFENTRAVHSSMDKRLRYQYYNNDQLKPFSEINIHYLNKIISLCEDKGVELIFLNTPLHAYYSNQIPDEYKEKLREIIHQNHLQIIDLSNLKLRDECYAPDGDHLSLKGAEEITLTLMENKNIPPEKK